MKLFVLVLVFGMFFISLVGATNIGTFKQGQQIQITNYCSTGDCTYANLTTIDLPNGTINYINSAMTQNGQNFNYSYIPSILGNYIFNTCSDPNGVKICDSDSFTITQDGKTFSVAKSIGYIGFLILTLFTLILTLWGGIKVGWKHKIVNGKIISINDFRYIKVFLFSMAYMITLFLFGLSYKLFNSAGMEGFNNFFNFIYQLFLKLMYPIMVLTVIIFVIIFLSNLKLKKLRSLGL